MQIDISLPTDSGVDSSVRQVELWLKQLELAVHHAQKSLKEMGIMLEERDGTLPALSAYLRIAGFDADEVEGKEGSANRIDIRIYEA